MSIFDLYFKIIEYRGDTIYESVLRKWILENNYIDFIDEMSEKIRYNTVDFTQEDRWELYALSRVLDMLTLYFQNDNRKDKTEWSVPQISVSDYAQFCELIGLEISTPQIFNPFDCEIFEAIESEHDFEIIECLIPAVKLKNMVIKRAGVKISVNSRKHDLHVINNSAIYWSYRRNNRRWFDLSQGWGSSSQWRTDFRVDIETENSFVYNLNGTLNLNSPDTKLNDQLEEDNLTIEDAIELTKYRHFINSIKDDSDLFPYYFMYEEQKSNK